MVQQVDKVVQLPHFVVLHAARRSHEARAEVARRLGDAQGSDCRLS